MARRPRFDGEGQDAPDAGAPRDAIYYLQLARQARRLAAEHADPDVARRLRESAVRHEHMARQLKRKEDRAKGKRRFVTRWRAFLRKLRGRG